MTGLGLASTRLSTAPRMATLSGGYWNCYITGSIFPTSFVEVRAHRGEPYNEATDRITCTARRAEDVPLLWNAPSGRIIYQFTPDPCESEDTLYTASVRIRPRLRYQLSGYVHVATRRRRPTIPSHPRRQRLTLYATERPVLSRVCLLFPRSRTCNG
jgi:hypothetical protein